MRTPQQNTPTVPTLPEDFVLARQLAEAMTANPSSARTTPWTVEDVLGVALNRGLEALVKTYLPASG